MAKKQQSGDNNQLFMGAGIGLLIAGAAYYLMNGNGEPASPGPIVNNTTVATQSNNAIPATNSAVQPPAISTGAPVPVGSQPIQPGGLPPATSTAASTAPNSNTINNAAMPAGETAESATVAATTDGTPVVNDTPEMKTDTPVIPTEELKLTELIKRVEPSVVRINTRSSAGYSIGSGYVVDKDGTIVTNYHVIEGAKEATVEFEDGTTANVTGFKHYDPLYDIAIIQIDVPEKVLNPIPFATSLPDKGTSVVAFGAPQGLSFTATEGIISAIRPQEEMQGQIGIDLKGTWLQTSTPISPGNSGGPLVNMFGQLVAMNTMQMTSGQNLNFAVSVLDVQNMLTESAAKPLEKLDPEKLVEVDRSIKRKLARDISETDRGKELLAKVDEIFLVLIYKVSNFDPTGKMTDTIYSYAEQSIKKAGVNLSFGEPSGDAAVMIVTVDMKLARNATAGTQEVVVDAFLICEDPNEKSVNKMVKIWTQEQTDMGTVAIDAIARGQIPRSINTSLTSFFNKFRLERSKAERETGTK